MIKAFFLRIVSKSQCNRIHKNRRSKTKRKEVSGPFRLLQIGQRTPFKFWPRWLSSCWTIIASWLIYRTSITCTFIAVVYVDDFLKEKEIGVFCVIRCEKSLDSQPWIFKGLLRHIIGVGADHVPSSVKIFSNNKYHTATRKHGSVTCRDSPICLVTTSRQVGQNCEWESKIKKYRQREFVRDGEKNRTVICFLKNQRAVPAAKPG